MRHLPPGCALHRTLAGEAALWGNQEELLALLAELLDAGNRMFMQANSRKGARIPKPLRIPRPGRQEERPRSAIRDLMALLPRRKDPEPDGA